LVPAEIISYNGVKPRLKQSANAALSTHVHTRYKNPIFEQGVHTHPAIIRQPKTRDACHDQFYRLGLQNNFYPRLNGKHRTAARLIKQVAVNCKTKNLAVHEKFLLKLMSPYLNQAYRNAQTITHMQQKLTLVDQALYRLNLGLIFLTPDGKISLATTGAMRQVTSYFGPRPLRENRLPEPLWRWVKQQEIALKEKDDVLLRRSRLVLRREGKRLMIRLVSDLDQNLLLLEEHPTTMQLQSLVPFGLSPREAQVLDWVAQGKTNKEIGVILELSPRTVQKHLEHIYRKIYVESRTAAAAKAYEIASMAYPSDKYVFPHYH
jgi:DNA-binding CsgD family transcriptional regulator